MKRVAIITGSTRGIGLGLAKAFLNQNYRVALNYCSDDKKAKSAISELSSKEVICVKADVSLKQEREYLLSEVEEKLGGFDVLINNAAIIRDGRFLEITEKIFNEVMLCNFYAPST